jgi:hypothetical protein
VAERFKAAVLKTANPQGFVGSNPTPSASALSITMAATLFGIAVLPADRLRHVLKRALHGLLEL